MFYVNSILIKLEKYIDITSMKDILKTIYQK